MVRIKNEILKRAVIAGASAALTFQRNKKNSSEEQILEEVVVNMNSILEKIDKE